MTRTEFINSIRSKYPQYNNIDDNTLFNKIIEKYPVYKNKITDTQTSQQQTPQQQTTVTPKKEEPGLLEGVKTFLFGDEDKKPKAELISEKYVETEEETPYPFSKPTPISLLDKEYNQKIKAEEDKYNTSVSILSETVKNAVYTGYQVQNYNTDLASLSKQKNESITNLVTEKLKREGKNLNPIEQEQETINYKNKIQANKTTIENKAKEKKSYLDEIRKVAGGDSPSLSDILNVRENLSDINKNVSNIFKSVRNTWDYNTKVDDDIAKAETAKNENQKILDFVGKGVNPFKNVEYHNAEDVKRAASYIDPSIESASKKAREKIGEITTKIFPTAEIKEDDKKEGKLGFLKTLEAEFSIDNLIKAGSMLVFNPLAILAKDKIKIEKFTNLTAEQREKYAIDKSYRLAANNLDNSLTPLYDKIQSEIGIPKSEVVGKIDTYLTAKKEREEGLYPNIGKLIENDIKLFNNPDFQNIADTYSKSAITTKLDGKWRLLSLANVDLYNQEKAKAFGTINKVENIGRKEAIRTAILDKNVEEQGLLSKEGFDKALYNTAWTALKFGDFAVNQTAAAAQISTQLGSTAFTGKAYTPEWTENIINNTDLFDNLTQQDSHFKLSIFKKDKYIDRILPTGDIVKVQFDPEGEIINAFGGGMEYTINNPEVMQWLANDFEANKEEIVANGKSLWETEGGKAVFLENVWNSMAPEMVEEMPSLLVAAGAGRIAGALIKGAANERRLAQGAEYMINVASNMTEQYPSIYKKYQEAAQDKDNPFPALGASGALAFGTLFTSTLQSKAIGLTGKDINKVVMPEAIEATSEAVKIINKEFAKIPDITLREKLTNAVINKVMFQNIMASAGRVLKTSAKVGGQEATEEVILEPLINVAANFINEKITGDRAYNQETLKDLNFLNPDVAITSFFTGSTLSQGMDIVKSMSNKGPFSKEDYLKTAFENEATFTSMVDIMTQSSTNNFSEENQAKMMADYKALKDSYNARKSELGVNDEALATLNFANPVIKGFVKSIGETEQSLNKVNSGRTFDNAIIRQSLNERELAEKKIALDEEAAKGNVSVSPEGTYRTVGSNPLTEELGKQISEYEQLQLSNNNLTTFIDTFNKETKPVQKQYIQELNQVTSEAPDLIYAKNSKEGNYAYKAVSNAIMDKQMAMSQLEKTNAEIETAVIDGTDTKELQVQKQNLEKAIKASDKTITTLKKQYKAGRVNTQNETIDRFNEFRTASLVLQEKLQSMAGVDATDEEIEQSEINDAYADYLDAFKALKKSNSTLKKEYGVEVLDSKYTPISLEEFQAKKNNIKEKNTLSKKLSENKGTLGEVERLIGLEYATGAKRTKDRMQVTTPKDKEEIKAILDDKEQVYEYAKRLGFNKKKSYAQTKKAVRTYLNKQLSTQDETRLEGVSAVFVEKTPRQVNGNPMFEVEGALYKPAGYSVSPTMMTQEERNTVLTNAVISEIAKQVFNNSLLLTPYNVSQIINKVIIESGFDTEVGIDNRSLQFIAETILALKADLDAKGSSYKFNDDVVISKLSDDTERGYEGVATTPILTVVDTEGNVHLIDFKSFSAGKYEAASSGWSNNLTEIQAIFQDNGITVASINVLPIRVNNTSTTENGLTNLVIGKTSFNTIPNNDNPISRTLLQLTTSESILTTLEEEGLLTKEEVESFDDIPLDEEDAPITPADKLKEDSLVVLAPEIVVTTEDNTTTEIEAKKADIEKRRQEGLKKFGTSEKETSKNGIKVLGVNEYVSRELMELAYSNDSGNNPKIGGAGQSLDRIIERGGYSKEELLQLLKPEIDKINAKYDAELAALEQTTTASPVELQFPEIDLASTTEKDMKVEDKNKHTKDTPKEVMEEETPEGVFAGLGKGVYIQVKYIQAKETKDDFYMIKIFGDTDLANRYGKKKMSLEDLKLVYEANNWFAPKSFEPKDPKKLSTYQLRYADTLTPVLSKNYVEFVQPNGFNEVINDITVAADLIGTEVEIVENNEPGYNGTNEGYNDTNEVQKDFKNKASLSIVNENGEKIAVVPPNSPLRDNLKITNKNGLNRLQPTIATIKDIKFNNFNRKPDELFSEWERKALASGVLVPGEYEMVYIGMERGMPVFKNKNGVVVPGRVPKKPELGSAYLFITNFPTKNIMIPMGTPKLAELGYTIQDLNPLFALIDINEFTKNEANAESIYSNFIAQLDALVREGKLKDPKLKDLQFLLSSELGGQELTLRATSTQLNIDKLDAIGGYNDKEEKEGILINFLLNRIITMNDETLGSHSIGVNPEILFADNALVLDNIKPKPKAKKQILSSTASQPRNTTIISELLSRLKETGLANEVFEMTNDEIVEKLVELGVEEGVARQVVASMMEKNINVDGVITKVKPIDVDVVNGFYSPLEKIISESKQDKMPSKQWIEKFAKGEEAKWTGLTDWLSQQEGSVSKNDILNYLKDNRINIVEVVKSDNTKSDELKKFDEIINTLNSRGYNISVDDYGTSEMNVRGVDDGTTFLEEGNGGFTNEELVNDGYTLKETHDEDVKLLEKAQKEANRIRNLQQKDDNLQGTKFYQYQLEGEKSNYKEVLVTLPISSKNSRGWQDYRDEMVQKGLSPKEADETRRFLLGSPIENIDMASVELSRKKMGQKFFDDYQDVLSDKENRSVKENQFQSSHFSESNILVHLRMNTRTDAEGNKVLFLEEVQSDWGQKGKKEGFNKEPKYKSMPSGEKFRSQIEESIGSVQDIVIDKNESGDSVVIKKGNKFYIADLEEGEIDVDGMYEADTPDFFQEYSTLTPSAPFVTDTNAWTKLGLKVALKEAVSQGAVKIAWTTGEQQNERYDLSKTVDEINWKLDDDQTYQIDLLYKDGKTDGRINIKPNELENYIGKELASKIINESKTELENSDEADGTLSGEGLKVGGTGMKGFYGSPSEGKLGIVGNVAKTLFKQEPKTVKVKTGNQINKEAILVVRRTPNKRYYVEIISENTTKELTNEDGSRLYFESKDDATKYGEKKIKDGIDTINNSNNSTQYSIDITPELKAEVEEGLPLFQKQLSDNNITPTTAGFVYDGDVYLNIDNMNLDTPIHEFGHLWLSWAKSNLAEAYARGLELAKSDEAEPYRQYVMETQPDLKVDSEAFLDEVLAQAIGDNGARLVEENSAETKSWLQGLWDAIGKMLGISELVANGGYKTLTLNDYAKAVAVDLLKGEKFTGKDGKTGETPDIRFQIVSLPNKDVKKLEKLANFETESVIIESNGAKAELYNEQLLDGDNSIYISEISSDVKGQGKATELLRKLQSFADNNGTILSLRASVENNIQTEGGLNQEQLVNWYNKNGFSIEEGYNNFDSDPKAPFMLYFPKNKIEVSTEETTQIPDCV